MDSSTQSMLTDLGFLANGPPSSGAVQSIERHAPLGLPTDYAKFLRSTGGGEFPYLMICRCRETPPCAFGGHAMFDTFLDVDEINRWHESLRSVHDLPASALLLPIADAAGGDLYGLRAAGDGFEVVYWDHNYADVYPVAGSFTDLIMRLRRDPDETAPEPARARVRLDPDLL